MSARKLATVTMRDDTLPHQIRLGFRRDVPGSTQISVSCTCRATGGGGGGGPEYEPLDARARWDDPDEPMAIWRAHMEAS